MLLGDVRCSARCPHYSEPLLVFRQTYGDVAEAGQLVVGIAGFRRKQV